MEKKSTNIFHVHHHKASSSSSKAKTKNKVKENKAGGGKSPTRLQKRAPASLKIDPAAKVVDDVSVLNSSGIIPLLTPAIVAPEPLYLMEEERSSENVFHEQQPAAGKNRNKGSASPSSTPRFGGEYRDLGLPSTMPESASLFTFFHTQCAITNRL